MRNFLPLLVFIELSATGIRGLIDSQHRKNAKIPPYPSPFWSVLRSDRHTSNIKIVCWVSSNLYSLFCFFFISRLPGACISVPTLNSVTPTHSPDYATNATHQGSSPQLPNESLTAARFSYLPTSSLFRRLYDLVDLLSSLVHHGLAH